MTPIRFIQTAVVLLFSSIALISQSSRDNPPNILMIAVDDLKTIGSLYSEENGDFLSYIYPDVQLRKEVVSRMTPNIQRLASRGITFRNAYCASPACNPSRAAILTGIRPHVSGLTTNAGGVFFRDYQYQGKRLLADVTTLPELLKAHGWYTASTGKIYHSGKTYEHSDGARSWNDWVNVACNAGKKTRSGYCPRSLDWGQEGDDQQTFVKLKDYRTAAFIAELLENGRSVFDSTTFELPEQNPFFIGCGIFRPHLPFYATKDLLDLFPVEEMTLSDEFLEYLIEDGRDLPGAARRIGGFSVDENGNPIIGNDRFIDLLEKGKSIDSDHGHLDAWKDMLKHYFASCAIADRAVGRLLDGLEKSPYAENTIVILWSDHGYHLGEKLHETKFTLWDDGSRVNFIFSDPQHPENNGTDCLKPVSLMDLYPTIAAIAGLPLPDSRITGNDLAPLLLDPSFEAKRTALTTFGNVSTNMLRTDSQKVIRYNGNPQDVEVYDMVNDPEEYRNLAVEAEHSTAVSDLDRALTEELERTRKF